MRCGAYCTATAFDMSGLTSYLRSAYLVKRFREVIHVQFSEGLEAGETPEGGGAFFFPYGALICWGLTGEREARLLQEVRSFEQQRIETIEDDDFAYSYGRSASILEDEIVLPNDELLTKLAFSHGLAQSVKLSAFEQTIQKTIHLTRELPELLAKRGDIKLSRRETRRMMGRLFIDRSSINLHQELLDIPEFFWEHDDLEPYYAMVAHYLDCESRVNILNQRLLILQELFDMLTAELNHQYSSRLEWYIIVLIIIEVLLHLATDVFKLF